MVVRERHGLDGRDRMDDRSSHEVNHDQGFGNV